MKENKATAAVKTRKRIFPIFVFVITFVVFGLFTTVQMKIIGAYINYAALPPRLVASALLCWLIAAVTFTLLTQYQITHRYEKPVEQFALATQQVARGDFSVYVPTRHRADKLDYLDTAFMNFNKMVEELGSIETLKIDFFSNVSHEIKTPLAVIQNTAELLENEALSPEERQAHVVVIRRSTKRLSSLITNILKLNKLESQVIRPMAESYNLYAQLCECALAFEDLWNKKGVEFEADIQEVVTIESDPSLLELVWNNLLSNAFKFTEAGGMVTLRQWSDPSSVFVSVADTGCGMSRETMAHIFEKFYQGDTSHATQGNGLGLTLSLRVLDLLGGSIEVDSRQGHGTTFTVRLPITPNKGEGATES